ncbi:MAG: hypothetical protein K940chlam6_00085 [Chlamydiae bacterium]|nr:hypothetical protein [Chlamydiota bacterium]
MSIKIDNKNEPIELQTLVTENTDVEQLTFSELIHQMDGPNTVKSYGIAAKLFNIEEENLSEQMIKIKLIFENFKHIKNKTFIEISESDFFKKYDKEVKEDTLIFINTLREELKEEKFSTIEDALKWLNEPKTKDQLLQIKFLDLKDKNIKAIPLEITRLPNLETIYGIQSCKLSPIILKEFPDLDDKFFKIDPIDLAYAEGI